MTDEQTRLLGKLQDEADRLVNEATGFQKAVKEMNVNDTGTYPDVSELDLSTDDAEDALAELEGEIEVEDDEDEEEDAKEDDEQQ